MFDTGPRDSSHKIVFIANSALSFCYYYAGFLIDNPCERVIGPPKGVVSHTGRKQQQYSASSGIPILNVYLLVWREVG